MKPTPRALAGLLRRVEIRALARIAREQGVGVWIVGGAVRDVLAGRTLPDVDAAVRGSAERLAREMEREGHGRAVFLSRGRPGPPVWRLAGKREIDLAELEGETILQDLGRRDFTVNAMALDLETRELIDPFGGASDLARRRLRLVSAENLRHDPLRIMRVARFIATHDLSPDAGVSAACRRRAPLLSGVAPERIAAELSKILEAPAAVPALRWAASARVLAFALSLPPSSRKPREITEALAPLDRPRLRGLSPQARRRLRLARMAGALGLTPRQARRDLEKRRFSGIEAREVWRLLELAESARGLRGDREQWGWVRDAGAEAEEAALLLALDSRDRALARRLVSRVRRRSVPLRVKGGDLVRWLGIPPGPLVGQLLRELEIEALRGRVRDRRQARAWVRRALHGAPERASYNLPA
jgi:tRNA nucleotidyltransferase/poly(A) polymerase